MIKPHVVLDASALIAYFKQEKGYQEVSNALANGAAISTVNLGEVYGKIVSEGWNLEEISPRLKALGLLIVPFGEEEAKITAELYRIGTSVGLSLGDRACLSLGLKLGLQVLTTDKTWSKLNLQIDVRVLR